MDHQPFALFTWCKEQQDKERTEGELFWQYKQHLQLSLSSAGPTCGELWPVIQRKAFFLNKSLFSYSYSFSHAPGKTRCTMVCTTTMTFKVPRLRLSSTQELCECWSRSSFDEKSLASKSSPPQPLQWQWQWQWQCIVYNVPELLLFNVAQLRLRL